MKKLYIIIAILIIFTSLQGCQYKTTTEKLTNYQNEIDNLNNQIQVLQNENKSLDSENKKIEDENKQIEESNNELVMKINNITTSNNEKEAYLKQINQLEEELHNTKSFFENNLKEFYTYIEHKENLKAKFVEIFNQPIE